LRVERDEIADIWKEHQKRESVKIEAEAMVSRVAIAGAGMTGSYLYRLLESQGMKADIYGDAVSHAACGINPCAWGSTSSFRHHVRAAGLDPEQYVFKDFRVVNFEGVDMRAHLLTFDKPRLINDLRKGVEVLGGPVPPRRYERVIDATGLRRAYLPTIKDDLLVPCVQYRVRRERADSSKVVIQYGNLGYSWTFPLSDNEFHIGAGSVLADPKETLRESGFMNAGGKILCGCSGKVRSTSPLDSQPFVSTDSILGGQVWGVGESIGAVAPIAGEGNAPGMASARLLVANWDTPERYKSRILKEFSWMIDERKVIDKVAAGQRLGLQDWLILRRTGRRMGAPVSLSETRELLKCLTKKKSTSLRDSSISNECAK
jgi:flavin-dependent dehydrogenase